MLVLHAALFDDRLNLWAESSEPLSPAKPRRTRRKRGEPPQPARLDHGASPEDLQRALEAAGLDHEGAAIEMVAWLPTRRRKPVPSSGMIAPIPSGAGKSRIEPWTVNAIPLDPSVTLGFLAAVIGRTLLAPGLAIGDDLAFCATATRYAGTLVMRGQYLPDLQEIGGDRVARWQPFLAGAELDRFHALVRSAPPSAFAVGSKSDAPPAVSTSGAVRTLIGMLVDRLVRETVPAPTFRQDSIHEMWLAALHAPDGHLDAPDESLRRLHAAISSWSLPVTTLGRSPFRLAFRVEEPPLPQDDGIATDEEANWRVEYLLQSMEDPSLQVPLGIVWNQKKRGRRSRVELDFRRSLERLSRDTDLHDLVLTSLGQASGISPSVERSLHEPHPSGFAVPTPDAFRFLAEDAPVLEAAGFGVFVPSWWSRKGSRRRLKANAKVHAPKMKSRSGLSLDDLVDVDWSVALGDETLSSAELEALARAKTPLVRIRGQWVQLDAEEIRAAAEFWKHGGPEALSVQQLVRLGLRGTGAPGGLDLGEIKATGQIERVLERLRGEREWEELPPPDGFSGRLRPYQARGFSWLAFLQDVGFGACLADDMGLGKTIQTLALLQSRWTPGRNGAPVLLVCPTSVTGNWAREAERFTPELPVLIHHGVERKKGAAFVRQARKQAMVITSYSLLHRDLEVLKRVEWKGVILDEAQNIKNPRVPSRPRRRGRFRRRCASP